MKKHTQYQIAIVVLSTALIINAYFSSEWRNLAYRATAQGERLLTLADKTLVTTKACRKALQILVLKHGYITEEELEHANVKKDKK